MKKLFLFLSVALFNCAWTSAQNGVDIISELNNHYSIKYLSEARKQFQYEEPLFNFDDLKPLDMKGAGFTLEKSEMDEDGDLVEHYYKEINDDELHVLSIKKANGGFYVTDLDTVLIPYFPTKISYKDGSKLNLYTTPQNTRVVQKISPSGLVVQLFLSFDQRGNKTKEIPLLYLPGHPEKGYYLFHYNDDRSNGIRFNATKVLLIPDVCDEMNLRAQLNQFHLIGDDLATSKKDDTYINPSMLPSSDYPGCLIGDRWYYLIDNQLIDARLQFLAEFNEKYKELKCKLFPVNLNDTLIDVKYYKVYEGKSSISFMDSVVFRYNNGDKYKYVISRENGNKDNYYEVGTKHINDGILKIKKGKKPILTKADGTIIEITEATIPIPFGCKDSTYNDYKIYYGPQGSPILFPAFQYETVNLYTAKITHPDGSEEMTYYGMNQEKYQNKLVAFKAEKERLEAEEEAKKKQKEAEEAKKQAEEENEIKAQYNELCRMYGKKYVDAALQGSQNQTPPLVGMPERLFVGAYKAERYKDYGNTVVYRVYGWGVRNNRSAMTLGDRILLWTVTVTNEKVASYVIHKK